MIKSLLNINIEEEYIDMINDIIKILTTLLVVNLLMFVSNPKDNKFLGESYIKLIIFILLGFLTYWLVIKKIINFNNKDHEN